MRGVHPCASASKRCGSSCGERVGVYGDALEDDVGQGAVFLADRRTLHGVQCLPAVQQVPDHARLACAHAHPAASSGGVHGGKRITQDGVHARPPHRLGTAGRRR